MIFKQPGNIFLNFDTKSFILVSESPADESEEETESAASMRMKEYRQKVLERRLERKRRRLESITLAERSLPPGNHRDCSLGERRKSSQRLHQRRQLRKRVALQRRTPKL